MAQFLDIVSHDGVFVMRLLVAMVLGGLVGLERQTRGRVDSAMPYSRQTDVSGRPPSTALSAWTI